MFGELYKPIVLENTHECHHCSNLNRISMKKSRFLIMWGSTRWYIRQTGMKASWFDYTFRFHFEIYCSFGSVIKCKRVVPNNLDLRFRWSDTWFQTYLNWRIPFMQVIMVPAFTSWRMQSSIHWISMSHFFLPHGSLSFV